MADDDKKYPATSPELGQLFQIDPNKTATPGPASVSAASPADLPVFADGDDEEELQVAEDQQGTQPAITDLSVTQREEEQVEQAEAAKEAGAQAGGILGWLKKAAPYLVVFAIGIGLYYFYFSDFSLNKIFRTDSATEETVKQKNAALDALKKQEAGSYQKWIQQFFFNVNDAQIIALDTDVSGNGLTNFQKYLLNLNPKVYATLGSESGDGQQIIDGNNPWTGQPLTDEQKKIVETYFDKEAISARIAAARSNNDNTAFAPYVSTDSPYYQPGVSGVARDNQAPLSPAPAAIPQNNAGQVAGNTIPAVTAPTPQPVAPIPSQRAAPVTGVDTASMNSLGIDTSIPGRIDIPRVKITVPLIWSKSTGDFEADLKRGVVHYTGTPLPGSIGTSYVAGHSSGTFLDKSPYKQIFAGIGNMQNGDTFTITVTLQGGRQAILHYVVGGITEYKADDQRQFLQTPDSVVALSTCWPLNTTARRKVVFAALTSIDK